MPAESRMQLGNGIMRVVNGNIVMDFGVSRITLGESVEIRSGDVVHELETLDNFRGGIKVNETVVSSAQVFNLICSVESYDIDMNPDAMNAGLPESITDEIAHRLSEELDNAVVDLFINPEIQDEPDTSSNLKLNTVHTGVRKLKLAK